MAIAYDGHRGNAQEKVSDTSLVVTIAGADIPIGSLVIVRANTDNITTTTGDSTDHSIADSGGNSWTRIKERTYSPTGVAGDGVTASLWYSILTTGLTSGSSTVTLTVPTLTAKTMGVEEFTGTSLTYESANTAEQTADPRSVTLGSLTSREHLLIAFSGVEGTGLFTSEDADYSSFATNVIQTTEGAAATNVMQFGAYRIATLTTDTRTADMTAARDGVDMLAAFYEAAGGAMSGSSAGTSTAAGALAGSGALSGTATAAGTPTATLLGAGALAGASAGVASVSGAIVGAGALIGTADGVATVSGLLAGAGALIGASAGVATISGLLAGAGTLAGLAEGAATVSGTLEEFTSGAISGAAAGIATVSGALLGAGALVGAADGTVTVSGTLLGTGALAGLSEGLGATTATLSGAGLLAGLSEALASVSGVLAGDGALAGLSEGITTISGTLLGSGTLAGTSAGLATISGTLADLVAATGIINTTIRARSLATYARGYLALIARQRDATTKLRQ